MLLMYRLTGMDARKSDSSFSNLTKNSDFTESISYDANGNILQYQGNGKQTFLGKHLGMDSLTYSYQSGTYGSTVKYFYDAAGNRISETVLKGGITNIS